MRQGRRSKNAALLALLIGTSMAWIGCRADESMDKPPAAKRDPAAQAPAAQAPAAQAPGAAAPKVAELGQKAPDFTLQDVDGKTVRLADFKGKRVVLEWFNPTCPYCKQAYSDAGALHELPEKLIAEGVVWLSVNSQGPDAGGAGAEENKSFMKEHGMRAPMLLDPTGVVGRSYGAKSTPHCFVIDEKGVLRYSGALDNAPAGKVKGDGGVVNYVENALGEIASGKPVTTSETRSYG